jgi:Tol biopolymer transport system component
MFVGLTLVVASCAADDSQDALDYTVVIGKDVGRVFDHALSPDGTRLAFGVPVDGQGAIMVANTDGSDVTRLTFGVWDQDPVWSPDGRWIAYFAEAPDFDLFVVPSAGGDTRALALGQSVDRPQGWLPDGSAVVFWRAGRGSNLQTLAVDLDGGDPRALVTATDGNVDAAVSPDGSMVAYELMMGGNHSVWVQSVSGGEARQLTTEGMEHVTSQHMWSPDSRFLLYRSMRTGTSDIWLVDVQTGDQRQLTTDVRNDRDPRWSPDGRWVAFTSDRGGQTDLWIVSAQGGEARRATNDLAVEGEPEWSPDGSTLYYGSVDETEQLQVTTLDGSESRPLAGWDGYQIGDAVVSPDGSTVLFESNRSGHWDLWSVPLAGGDPVPFATSAFSDGDPQYSPDGSQVAFMSWRGGSGDVWVTTTAGSEPRRLTDWPSFEGFPTWSPDGSMMAFVSDRDGSQRDVWVVPAAGGEPRRLTTDAGAGKADWSPDGQYLYYVGAAAGGASEVYRVAVDGGTPVGLGANARAGGQDAIGALSPDGRHYAYGAFEGGWAFIEVIPTDGGAARRLTSRTERVYQPTASWAPDGRSLLVVDYDFSSDTYDIHRVTWPDGEWQPLTATTDASESVAAFLPDGTGMVVEHSTGSAQVLSVDVTPLLHDGTDE